MLKNQRGIAHLLLLIAFVVVICGIGFAGYKVWQHQQVANPHIEERFDYKRSHPKTIKAVLDPGTMDVKLLMTDELANMKAQGVNTVYVYVDYSFENGEPMLTHHGGKGSDQEAIENELIENIRLIKQKGFAAHVAISFGAGQGLPFDIPVAELLDKVEPISIKWANIAEQYKVETFAPASEIDWQIFREYYDSDWEDKTGHDEAAHLSNKYHERVLPKLRANFKGKLIYQAGLWSDKLGVPGYDIFGQPVSFVNRDVDEWSKNQVPELISFAQTNAKRQKSDWMITEFWVPTNESNGDPNGGPPLKTQSGKPVSEVQADVYREMFKHYKTVTGQKPIGFGYTAYLNSTARVKNTPTEEVISDFFNTLK